MRENTLSPRKVFFATYTPPRKMDHTLFAACGPRTLRVFFDSLSSLSRIRQGAFCIGKENIPQRTASPVPRRRGGALSGQGSHVPYMVYTNGSEGFFITGAGVAAATRVPLRTEWVKNTLPPTTEPSPMSVSPPRIDAPE